MPSRTIHRAVMQVMKPFDAPGEFCPTAIQGFLVTVCLPEEIKIEFANCIKKALNKDILYIF